ncbi:DUF3862 domain-containing protein [Endozoicomonas sp. OPT23]|uniref:DUF3862 domain-containing protein n=1 Tax=Endozoicomonas sp. OPT23 TaxID=2072845 RepID=UPI00129BA6B0|nr:DUF3862 domain-containing protein [Endozoicomonas sp. OPT23]MRI33493.1 DUF3862 domain-containing protein [Endozoicomonas sp. OPT23]
MRTALFLSGCTHLNQSSFDRLDAGMNIEEVEGILGKPSNCDEDFGRLSCIWNSGEREVKVDYVQGKIVVFSAEGLQ